jgi:hypothetical protein
MAAVKIVLYLFGGLLTAPGALLAFFFWNVGQAAQQKGLLQMLWFAFMRFLDLFEWLFAIVVPVLVIWLVLAFVPKYRIIGESGAALAAAASIFMMFAYGSPPRLDQLFVPIISFVGLALNLWLIWWELAQLKPR